MKGKKLAFKYICLCLMLLIVILVGIVTYISSKNISTYVSKKEFDKKIGLI